MRVHDTRPGRMEQGRDRASQCYRCGTPAGVFSHSCEYEVNDIQSECYGNVSVLVPLRVSDIIELLERGSMSSEATERLACALVAREKERLENERRRIPLLSEKALAHAYLLQKSNALKEANERANYLEQQRRARNFVYEIQHAHSVLRR